MHRAHLGLGVRRRAGPASRIRSGRRGGLHPRPRFRASRDRRCRIRNVNRNVPLDSLVSGIESLRIAGDARVPISGITLDSRRVQPGYLFAALRGERADGLDFVAGALARGAVAILSDRPRPASVPCSWVQAADARAALAEVARAFFGRPDEEIPVIGITGTNGKTTVSYLLEAIVRASGGNAGVL